jgi:hypothetical protein
MPDPIVQARIRAGSFWYQDGLAELSLGTFSLLQVAWLLSMKSSWAALGTLIYVLLLAAFVRMMAKMRERITYQRSGYIEPGEAVQKFRIWSAAMTISIFIALALAFRYRVVIGWDPQRWAYSLPGVTGLAIFAVSAYVGVRYGLQRYLLVGLLSLVLGVAVSIECPARWATLIWGAGVSCAWLCAGGFTFRNYLRNTLPDAYRK